MVINKARSRKRAAVRGEEDVVISALYYIIRPLRAKSQLDKLLVMGVDNWNFLHYGTVAGSFSCQVFVP
jgi:hypothetical protein